jgi:hypothetical protein
MSNKCWYAGHSIVEMRFANFTRKEIRESEKHAGIESKPEKCPLAAQCERHNGFSGAWDRVVLVAASGVLFSHIIKGSPLARRRNDDCHRIYGCR